MYDVEAWAEIRRLGLAEGVPIKEIVRRTGIARNTVRARCGRGTAGLCAAGEGFGGRPVRAGDPPVVDG